VRACSDPRVQPAAARWICFPTLVPYRNGSSVWPGGTKVLATPRLLRMIVGYLKVTRGSGDRIQETPFWSDQFH
jgi:hypothetical protein